MELKSAIFDMDGVITDTAQIHFKAWKQIFDSYLIQQSQQSATSLPLFSQEDYLQYVDGMSRVDGVKRFLHSRKLICDLDNLSQDDQAIIEKISTSKNDVFLNIITTEGVKVFESTIKLVKELKKLNLKAAVISSSKNCRDILTRAKVIDLFDAIVDGQELSQRNLKGKPEPDIFLEAAKRINADPHETVVIEDAISGIIAGKAGKFGLVIGIDRRKEHYLQFLQQGADIVVSDLSEIKLSQLQHELKKKFPPLLDNFNDIVKQIKDRVLLLFTDYDGTLTPIVPRPELAVLSKEMKDILYQLKQFCNIIIISGRELNNLEEKVGINGLYYAANHGFEIIGPDHFATKFEIGHDFLDLIQSTYEYLSADLESIENCIIENKIFTISVHYRLVAEEQVPIIEKIVKSYAAANPKIAMHHGKKVFEIRPRIEWNKGKAVEYILDKIQEDFHEVFPMYLGDDVTDEDAFFALKNKGIGILVSENTKKSYASYRLKDPNEVYYLLKAILSFVRVHPTLLHREQNWSLIYDAYQPEQEKLREALTTLGNGYFATRGALDSFHNDDIHYPGTYFAGSYNRIPSIIAGEEIFNEDLVNMPNWLPVTFKVEGGDWFDLEHYQLLEYQQHLNLRKGILTRTLRVEDNEGRVTRLQFVRFVSMAKPHLAVQRFSIQPENWSGNVLIQSGLDGSVINNGVTRYQELNSKHLEILKIESPNPNELSLLTRTTQSHIETAYTASHLLFENKQPIDVSGEIKIANETIYQFIKHSVSQGKELILEKRVVVATNKDPASTDSLTDTKMLISYLNHESFEQLLEEHIHVWKTFWKRCDIKITSEGEDQRIVRLHIFHLLQTISKNSVDLDIGVPARGLHGESYRGHIFWDEVFIIPFYTFYFPEMARALLMYRYRRLTMARYLAVKAGFKGAMYPWQSASNGDEVTQLIHLNPRSNEWLPDYSHYQRHVNAAIVYNIWQYYLITQDKDFITNFGAEIALEIARFWASISHYNPSSGKYEIHQVVGPDEYHERYPGSNEAGVRNNAYTNVMAVWSIERALDILNLLEASSAKELKEKIHLTDHELQQWQEITKAMKIPFHDDVIISQFEGYEDLPEFDWDFYVKKYGNIERLDRILKAENDSPDNYKVSKQADVLMLFYLLSVEELQTLFAKLGYTFNRDILIKNINYYLRRTSHGSTLSKVVLASLNQYVEEDHATKFYQDVLNSDIMDLQGGTTSEGVHLGAMASCININLFRFAGVQVKDNKLSFKPKLPARVSQLHFNIQFQQHWFDAKVTRNNIIVSLKQVSDTPVPIYINDQIYYLQGPEPVDVQVL